MQTKRFGRSGLKVSELCLGTMAFGRGGGPARRECEAMLRSFAERGGNFLDTAPSYGDGESERLVGALIAKERSRWVLATRATVPGCYRESGCELLVQLEGSLRRLGTDYVDLLWIDGWTHETAFVETMRALDGLVRTGKVLHFGVADSPAWVAAQANTLAAMHRWTPFVGLQIRYGLACREAEQDSLPMAESFGLSVCPWGALAGGATAGRTRRERHAPGGPRRAAAEMVHEVALDLGQPPAKVALAWLRQQGANLVPIVGPQTPAELREDLECTELLLTGPQLRRLSGRGLVEGPETGSPPAHAWA